MAIITRTGIPTYHCIDDVVCGDVIDAVFANKLAESMKAVAETGVLVTSFSNGTTHGRTRPYNGWTSGTNQIFPQYMTTQMVEVGKIYDRYVLEFTAKLGNLGGGNAMQWCNFWIADPSGTPNQRLGELKLNSYVIGIPGLEFLAQSEQVTRVRIDRAIEPYMLATMQAGEVASMDFQTKITVYGSGTHNIADPAYYAGVLSGELKFYKSCP